MEVTNINRHILILYTTLYREGGIKFERAAKVLAAEKKVQFPDCTIICKAVESKKEFVDELLTASSSLENSSGSNSTLNQIQELHFIGHSGMYGIMFGTTKWPEQMSPFEWKNLKLNFASNGAAYFHACRTGRWFAAFFARTFHVKTFGHFWYTTVSLKKDRFAWEGFSSDGKPIYIISVPGKKSHGIGGSITKYLSRPASYPMLEFEPTNETIDTTYDSVAPLYDETFEDIAVRADELRWLRGHLKKLKAPHLLDIGCGTGSFLRAIEDIVTQAHGVDLSSGMIEQAKKRSAAVSDKLTFSKID
ncbi:MAG: methyltransferase domain-containing protein, partial [Bdellovibrionota bacterium]